MIKIIFCALNEEQNLPTLITSITSNLTKLKQDYEIIACIDASTDNSQNIIIEAKKSYPIRILPLTMQKGLGSAYKRLFLELLDKSQENDIIISLDADNTHDPMQIKQMLEIIDQKNIDLLIASRFCKNSKIYKFPLHRKFISKTVSIILQILLPIQKIDGKKLKDYSSGFRAYKVKKLQELYKIEQNNIICEQDFIYTCEIALKLAKINARIDEFALIYNYDKKLGVSKLNIPKNFKRLLSLIAKGLYKKWFTYKK